MGQDLPTCSFCGKRQDEAGKIIAGPRERGICAACVGVGSRMLFEDAEAGQSLFRAYAEGSAFCGFCGKRGREVWRLLVGTTDNVCSECLGVCNEIFADDGDQAARELVAEIGRLGRRPRPASAGTLGGYTISAPDSLLRRLLDRIF